MMREDAISRLSSARKWWRPVFAFVAIMCILIIVSTVCWLLLSDRENLASAAGVIIAIITALSTPLTVLIGGRSYEKVQRADDGLNLGGFETARFHQEANQFDADTQHYNARDAPSTGNGQYD